MSDHLFPEDALHSLPTAKPKDRPLNPFRFPTTPPARGLLAAITAQVDDQLHATRPRKRQRRVDDKMTFEATVGAVLSDLILQCTIGAPKGVSLSRSNVWPPKRYRTPVHNKLLPRVLDAISQDGLGYVVQITGQQGFEPGQAFLTSLMPTDRLMEAVRAARLSDDDFETRHSGEVIHLIGPKPRFGSAALLDYPETEESTRLRAEIVEINAWLAQADLSIDEGAMADGDEFPDFAKRGLIRRFTQGSFDCGGRLWGGYWQEVKRDLRRTALWIDGEPAAELDFGQAGARILYGMAGATVPQIDLYAVPGFEQHREGIKQAMGAMSFSTSRLVRMPDGVKTRFGKVHTMSKVVAAVEAFHRPIAGMFFTGAGHRAQRIESDIIVQTTLRLINMGVTSLPIHDAVMVPRSAAPTTRDVMLEVFQEKAGVEGSVSSIPPDAL